MGNIALKFTSCSSLQCLEKSKERQSMSWLPVKYVLRMKCVCKQCQLRISITISKGMDCCSFDVSRHRRDEQQAGDENVTLPYWLSNASALLCLLQRNLRSNDFLTTTQRSAGSSGLISRVGHFAGPSWHELNYIRQAVGFLVIHQKRKKSLDEIRQDLGPVAEALFEITLTRFSGDILPATDAGIVLSIADSQVPPMTHLACEESLMVQVLVEKDRNLDLKQALELIAEVQHIKVDASTIDDVHQFVTRRLEQFLRIYSTENKELYHWGTVSISVSYIWPIVRVKPETPPRSALGAFTAEL
ncbi:glycine--tRNA ligase, chloroplastic/mitochondrial 2 isoform X1 [Fagus crenata]